MNSKAKYILFLLIACTWFIWLPCLLLAFAGKLCGWLLFNDDRSRWPS